ncbi:DUF4142 domain-containing protein [Pseudomonas helleri]|jgi:putative membrane protein|uniref:DUF4142 domain-containing protein n=1 Tax=Pseudomonas helleri TaxID=1608996 RepID=A0A0J6ICU9_9PSED|nr:MULTISPECIES: DUF4142 domain-containing protein [Pseudomonas]KMN10102.1 membrane protein [Pseudomonas helleri]KMN23266.1 membrane protein [Pseudomonas helleri]MQT31913.1 DUF4142 domain-containing protein [Pseudomonas helleri]MQT34738.1 DUF4142 domain-containing protein [Pseudomonas helleri]MQT48408.1 DUF4142 domain-containing protein [Pseudomonas helleri]
MKPLMAPKRFMAGCALAYALFVIGSAVAASPADFVDESSAAGIAAIETSRMAISKSSSTDVGSYAVEVIKDYTDANRDLKDIAQKQGLKVADQEEILSKAKKLMLQVQEGDSFDAAYAANQVKASEDAIELYKQQIDDPASPELQAFAEKYLPKLQMHLDMAKRLVSAHHKGDGAVLPE